MGATAFMWDNTPILWWYIVAAAGVAAVAIYQSYKNADDQARSLRAEIYSLKERLDRVESRISLMSRN